MGINCFFMTMGQIIEKTGYSHVRYIEGRGYCGIQHMMYTTGLFIGLEEDGCYCGRYCFETKYEAVLALKLWNGIGDPDGDWIKYKGFPHERSNPNYIKH